MHRTLRPFELFETERVDEAIELLSSYGRKARVLAGGLDLISKMRRWQINPEALVSIHKIRELEYIKSNGDEGIGLGALATLRSIELSPIIQNSYRLLYEAIHQIASVQVKTMGTAVGNLCVATPASDIAPPLMVLGANLKIRGPGEEKSVLLDQFYRGVDQTTLEPDEIVTEIRIPRVAPGSGGAFLKLSHTAACIAKVNVAVMVTLAGGICKNAKIALGSVAPTVIRARRAEAILKGGVVDIETVRSAAKAAAGESTPMSDLRSSAEYREEMVEVLVRRGIEKALERSKAK